MKGSTTITINQATMLTAMQQYMDTQFTTPHIVKDVKRSSNNASFGGGDEYDVEVEAADAAPKAA